MAHRMIMAESEFSHAQFSLFDNFTPDWVFFAFDSKSEEPEKQLVRIDRAMLYDINRSRSTLIWPVAVELKEEYSVTGKLQQLPAELNSKAVRFICTYRNCISLNRENLNDPGKEYQFDVAEFSTFQEWADHMKDHVHRKPFYTLDDLNRFLSLLWRLPVHYVKWTEQQGVEASVELFADGDEVHEQKYFLINANKKQKKEKVDKVVEEAVSTPDVVHGMIANLGDGENDKHCPTSPKRQKVPPLPAEEEENEEVGFISGYALVRHMRSNVRKMRLRNCNKDKLPFRFILSNPNHEQKLLKKLAHRLQLLLLSEFNCSEIFWSELSEDGRILTLMPLFFDREHGIFYYFNQMTVLYRPFEDDPEAAFQFPGNPTAGHPLERFYITNSFNRIFRLSTSVCSDVAQTADNGNEAPNGNGIGDRIV